VSTSTLLLRLSILEVSLPSREPISVLNLPSTASVLALSLATSASILGIDFAVEAMDTCHYPGEKSRITRDQNGDQPPDNLSVAQAAPLHRSIDRVARLRGLPSRKRLKNCRAEFAPFEVAQHD
jgi:hypothetical protein